MTFILTCLNILNLLLQSKENKMKILMIGTGYVGLVSGVCFAEIGNDVVCIDKNEKIINDLKSGVVPIYEPSLNELVCKNIDEKRLKFSQDLSNEIVSSDVIFIAVGTPRGKDDGSADLSFVFQAAEEIASHINKNSIVVIKSTVPVGTHKIVEKILNTNSKNITVKTASIPEFLREGFAVDDFMNPSRVVVGSKSEEAHSILFDLHKPLLKGKDDLFFKTEPETAELIKYASNAFLAVKISFINEISNLCEKVGANVEEVSEGMGLDNRIGRWGLSAGPGFGGSCFPKDTMALIHTAAQHESPVRIVEAAVAVNDSRKASLFSKIQEEFGNDLRNKKLAVLGLSFKAGTDDLRDSPSLELIPRLIEYGAKIRAYDPEAIDEAKKKLKGPIFWGNNLYETAENADAVIIMTEWDEFSQKNINLKKLFSAMQKKIIFDFRNMFDPSYISGHGFHYISVGRKTSRPF